MSAAGNESPEKYPLCSLAPMLGTYRPPTGPFNPAGSWRQAYGVYTLASTRGPAARRVGELVLSRRAQDAGQVELAVAYTKGLTGGTQKVTATLHTRADEKLATPRRWSFAIELLDTQGRPVPHAGVERTHAECRRGVIRIGEGRGARSIPAPGAYTVNWCLFDAVQRLGGKGAGPMEFLLIDHFDQPKPGQSLAFRAEMGIAVAGGKTVPTITYDQLGEGNVPWVYWVDRNGRLLLVVAGLEAYVLESSAPPAPA